jgi:DNA polymerase-3 subunit epsilon
MNWRRWLGRDRDALDPVSRCIVVDTETSGLDIDSDVLLAIGGVAVDRDGVVPGDSFEVVVRNAAGSSKENIELHGIGRQAQATGVPVDEAMRAFAAWAADAPGVAFHAPFDRTILARCAR